MVREATNHELVYVENSRYAETNTAASLYCALQADAREAILLNGDVYFDEAALRRASHTTLGAVCEFKEDVDPEEVQFLLASDGSVRGIGKDIGGAGEAVGIYRLSAAFISYYLRYYTTRDERRYYEDVFDRILRLEDVRNFETLHLDGAVAIEIDTPADLRRVREVAEGVGATGVEWKQRAQLAAS
jgi:choline kinase